MHGTVVILGTGGTIAGTRGAAPATRSATGPAQLGVADAGRGRAGAGRAGRWRPNRWPSSTARTWTHATWQRAGAARAPHHLARAEVAGVVVTHGTDTLEETAWFLHRVLAPAKPLVLTAAMRPATALPADGPQNLLDAVTVARAPGARGVLAVLAGARAWRGRTCARCTRYRLDAFGCGDAGPLALRRGRACCGASRAWPRASALGLAA